jgi:cytochrome oxidase Cu insertion factor (SCO1/SenC/PrrC family)
VAWPPREAARPGRLRAIVIRLTFAKQEYFMSKITLNQPAPDFTLTDYRGQSVSLGQFRGKLNVLLVFNRGFV